MTVQDLGIYIAAVVFTLIAVFSFLYCFIEFLVPRFYKNRKTVESFPELIEILSVIVNSEVDLYERDIFENNRPITNSNYDNFYKDMCDRIIRKISPDIWKALEKYITEEAIVSMIARRVKNYLNDKVGNPL